MTGRKRSTDLPQGRLEVPCTLTFVGESKDLLKIEKLKNAVPASLTIPVEPPKNGLKSLTFLLMMLICLMKLMMLYG